MVVLKNVSEVENFIAQIKSDEETIGFVPTMGALHSGHLQLVQNAAKNNDHVVVSIFVNPTQFNNSEDLQNYPRTEDEDIKLLENSGCEIVFIPSVKEIYPDGETSEHFDFGGLENQMEGKFRPGHFDGVATVVKRLLEIVQPDQAYFGEKDFQQLRIIQELVIQFKLPTKIIPISIIREPDGLAMSSRNKRLTSEMRAEAPQIVKILNEAKLFYKNHTVAETKDWVVEQFKSTKLNLEYFEIADEKTLEPISEKSTKTASRGFVAVFAGQIRLIDNLSFS